MRNEAGETTQAAQYGAVEICVAPCAAVLTRATAATAQRNVSIGKKTVGRAPHMPV
jgi:hypothetical protein